MKIKPEDRIEYKALAASVKAVETDNPNGEFEAILSTDALDRDGECIAPGAFDPLPKSIPIFYGHDWQAGAMPIAKAEPFYDGDVLKARGTFASTSRAQEVRALVNERMVDAMSVGFLNGRRASVEGRKTVVKGELFESSFTPIPINTTARVLASKDMMKAGARNSAADSDRLQQIHDLAVENGASCSMAKSIKAIVGTVEALQARVRDALEDAYGSWATCLHGVDPDKMLVYFEWYGNGDGDTYQQSYADDGAVVTLEGEAVEVDVHEIVVPDADADREAGEPGPTMMSTTSSTADAAGKAAAPTGAAAGPAADAAENEELALRARLLSIDALTAAAS